MTKAGGFSKKEYLLFGVATICIFLLCLCVGSVAVSPTETFQLLLKVLSNQPLPQGNTTAILLHVRLPRVMCAALIGSALSISGASMQGLLRNPLAEGSTLGVSAGAALGGVIAISTGLTIPGFPGGGTILLSMLFAFLSLMLILALAYRLDYSLTTSTIILIGVIFSMFASSLLSLMISFAGEKMNAVVFWTMGSLADSSYRNVVMLLLFLCICGTLILRFSRELNAFAVGEDNARNIGIDVRRVKLTVMIAISALIGVCVSVGGTISFVGLVIPHITRFLTGPNHRRLLPACLFSGAIFLMLADLVARILLNPQELPIGVVTSIIGAVVFVSIFYNMRKVR